MYTKSDLKQIVYSQLENLNATHDLLSIMKHQNQLNIPEYTALLSNKGILLTKKPNYYRCGAISDSKNPANNHQHFLFFVQ